MDNIIKSFEFESENVKLILNIKKEVYRGVLKMFIDGNIISNNPEITINKSLQLSSKSTSLIYKNSVFFWMSYNNGKGLRWANFKNETKFCYYTNVNEMKEKYIQQRDLIPNISDYFFDCMKNYKKLALLYDTSIFEIITD